jgi:thymidylate synthase (FAD)
VWIKARQAYEQALANGVAKEVARKVLPEGLTMSRMYVNGTVRSWLHYIDVRCDVATQKEHRDVAEQCKEIVYNLLPSLKEKV